MGITIPRPTMRAGENRKTQDILRRHAEFTRQFEAEGMTREEASRKAFLMVKFGAKPEKTE